MIQVVREMPRTLRRPREAARCMEPWGWDIELGRLVPASDSSAFAPTDLTGLEVWLRADRGITTVSSAVSAWANQSAVVDANRNAVQGTALLRPGYTAANAAWNNQATVDCTGSRFLATGTFAATISHPYTAICAFAPGATGAVQLAMDGLDGSHRVAIAHNPSDHVQAFGGGGAVIETTTTFTTAPRVAAAIFNGASSELYVNSSAAPEATGNAGAHDMIGLHVGILFDAGSFSLEGSVAEIIVVSGVIPPAELGAAFAYMGARYGKAWS